MSKQWHIWKIQKLLLFLHSVESYIWALILAVLPHTDWWTDTRKWLTARLQGVRASCPLVPAVTVGRLTYPGKIVQERDSFSQACSQHWSSSGKFDGQHLKDIRTKWTNCSDCWHSNTSHTLQIPEQEEVTRYLPATGCSMGRVV